MSEENEQPKNVSCFELSDGQVQLIASGGQPTYFYQLLDSNYKHKTYLILGASGTYTFLVNDLNNCTDTFSLQITEPEELIFDRKNPSFHSDIICFGGNEGQPKLKQVEVYLTIPIFLMVECPKALDYSPTYQQDYMH